MSAPHAVILHITERNSSVEELDQFIAQLQEELNFGLLGGPKYDSEKTHLGTTLVKNVDGDDAHSVFETVQDELTAIEARNMAKFNCQLTVTAREAVSDTLFIPN